MSSGLLNFLDTVGYDGNYAKKEIKKVLEEKNISYEDIDNSIIFRCRCNNIGLIDVKIDCEKLEIFTTTINNGEEYYDNIVSIKEILWFLRTYYFKSILDD